jgi:uncharacterized protein (TIGR00288 family)
MWPYCQENNEKFLNIVVLIDSENISHKYLQQIFERIAAHGRISVRRIYADWTDSRRNAWKTLIHEFSLVAIQQFSNTGSKNVCDFALVLDAMDLLHEGIFDCFCIVSSDSDFTRLAQKIREKGKTVIGLGNKQTANAFVKACNEFILLEDELLKTNDLDTERTQEIKAKFRPEIKTENKNEDKTTEAVAVETLDSLINTAVKNLPKYLDEWVLMSSIISYIKEIKPDFSLLDYEINGKKITKLKQFFENNEDFELNITNTVGFVKKK